MLNRRKSEFLTEASARELFRIPRSIIFLSISNCFLCFTKPLLGAVFRGSQRPPQIIKTKKKRLVSTLYDFLHFQKGTFWAPFSRSKPPETEYPVLWLTTWCRPCFSRKHNNYYAVGGYWFSKRRSLDEDVLNFIGLLLFGVSCLFTFLSLFSVKDE